MRAARWMLLGAAVAVAPGCACGWVRTDSSRSLQVVRRGVVDRTVDDVGRTGDFLAGIPGWFEKEFATSARNLHTTFELATDCPESNVTSDDPR